MSFELIISISAIFIALSSLIVAIWQNILTRKHNKLSVKPLICIDYHFTDDEELNGIYLDNTGLGPAIIKSFRVFIDEDEILSLNKNFLVINELIKTFNNLNIKYLVDKTIEKKLIENINSIYYNIKFLENIYDCYIELNEIFIDLLYIVIETIGKNKFSNNMDF